MKYVIGSFIVILVVISCKKATIETINTNNSRDSLTYQPKVPGSKWEYKRTIPSLPIFNLTYKFLRLTTDTTAYGSTFQIFSSDDNSTNGVNQYIRQEGNKYYTILTNSTNKPALLVLDADKNVNESWLGGTNGTDTYTYTMKQKIPVYVLDNFTFKNVLVVHLDRTGPNPLSVDTYYAQGVGQVKSEGLFSFGGINANGEIKLINLYLQ